MAGVCGPLRFWTSYTWEAESDLWACAEYHGWALAKNFLVGEGGFIIPLAKVALNSRTVIKSGLFCYFLEAKEDAKVLLLCGEEHHEDTEHRCRKKRAGSNDLRMRAYIKLNAC